MAIDRETKEAAAEYGKRLSHVMESVSEPLDARRDMTAAIMADIGMVQGVPLATTGTLLGTIIGGGSSYGIEVLAWPRALVALHLGDGMAYEELVTATKGREHDDQVDYTECLRDVCRACLTVIAGSCISAAVQDRADALRRYLEFLAQLIALAVNGAMGD